MFSLKQTIFSFFLFLSFFIIQPVYAGMFGGVPIISDEEYQAMAPAQRKQYEQELQKQIGSMSPAQQEAFMQDFAQAVFENLPPEEQQQVIDEVARVEAMSEDEQKKYLAKMEKELEQMIAAEAAAQQEPTPKPETQQIPKEPKPEKETKKKETKTAKIAEKEKAVKDAIILINEVIEGIDSFIIKLEARVDLSYKLAKWGKKKQLNSWSGGFKWKELKGKIDSLRALLDKLKDRDVKTKTHKYLYDLVENEKLYTRIYNLSVDLANYEPTIRAETGKPLAKKIKKKSNKATRSLIKAFVAELFAPKDDIVQSIQDIIKKYDPKAAKLRAKQEAEKKKALEESKRPRRVSKVKVVGEQQRSDYDLYDDSPYGDSDYSYGPSYGRDYDRGPSRDRGARRTTDRKRPSGRIGKGEPKKPRKPKTKAEKEKEKEEKKKDEALRTDSSANRSLKRLDDRLESIFDSLDENEKIYQLEKYLKENKFDKKLAKAIDSITNDLESAGMKLDMLGKKLKKMKPEEKNSYKKAIKKVGKKYEDELGGITKTIERIEKDTILLGNLSSEIGWKHFQIKPKDTDPIKMKAAQRKLKDAQAAVTRGTVATTAQQAAIDKAQKELQLLPIKKYIEEGFASPTTLSQFKKTAENVIKKAKELSR